MLLVVSAGAVIFVVADSKRVTSKDSWWRRNEITLVLSTISFFFPMFFEALGLIEYYHPRQQLRIQLARIMVLNLLNLYSLIFALFDKIKGMSAESDDLRPFIESNLIIPNEVIANTALSTATELTTMMCPNCSMTTIASLITTTLLPTIFQTLPPRRKPPTTTTSTTFATTTDAVTEIPTTASTESVLPIDYDQSVQHYYFENDTDVYEDYAERRRRNVEENATAEYSTQFGGQNWTDFLVTTMIADTTTNFQNFSVDDYLDYLTTKVKEATTVSYDNYDEEYSDEENYTDFLATTTEMSSTTEMEPTEISTTIVTYPVTPNLTRGEAERKIRSLCWETMFGQELVKLTVMDLVRVLSN